MNCLICNQREANKPGSHIIPHFLVASMVNEGLSGRYRENSFRISTGGTRYYFGRNVSPDHLEQVFGRQVTDEEIEENNRSHHYVIDYVFCTVCETKLSVLEGLYSDRVRRKVSERGGLNEEESKIAYALWLSVILRCSITQYAGFKLEQSVEDGISRMLNAVMDVTPSQTLANVNLAPYEFPMMILVYPNPPDPSRNSVLLHPDLRNSYLLIVNEYIVVFHYRDSIDIEKVSQQLEVNLPEPLEPPFSISFLSSEDREKIIKYALGLAVKSFVANTRKDFSMRYRAKNGIDASEELVDRFMQEIIFGEGVVETQRYASSRIESLTVKHGG